MANPHPKPPPPGSRTGRPKGSPHTLPDLRAMTLRALLKAGGVDYLVKQAHENPQPFLGLLGRVMPREVHTELTAEVRVRQEVRRELVENVIRLMMSTGESIEHTPALPMMLQAQKIEDEQLLSRRQSANRREAAIGVAGAVQRAAALFSGMHGDSQDIAGEPAGEAAGEAHEGAPSDAHTPDNRAIDRSRGTLATSGSEA